MGSYSLSSGVYIGFANDGGGQASVHIHISLRSCVCVCAVCSGSGQSDRNPSLLLIILGVWPSKCMCKYLILSSLHTHALLALCTYGLCKEGGSVSSTGKFLWDYDCSQAGGVMMITAKPTGERIVPVQWVYCSLGLHLGVALHHSGMGALMLTLFYSKYRIYKVLESAIKMFLCSAAKQ